MKYLQKLYKSDVYYALISKHGNNFNNAREEAQTMLEGWNGVLQCSKDEDLSEDLLYNIRVLQNVIDGFNDVING